MLMTNKSHPNFLFVVVEGVKHKEGRPENIRDNIFIGSAIM